MKTVQINNMTYIQDPVDHQFYRLSPEDARRPMSFKRAVKQCWEKYAIFDGRSRRSECWWFGLFSLLVIILPLAVSLLLSTAFNGSSQGVELLGYVVAIVMLIVLLGAGILLTVPMLSVMTRRLHDVGRSGWWLFGEIVLTLLTLIAFSIASSSVGFADSTAHMSLPMKLMAIYDTSMPLFILVATLSLSQVVFTLTILAFTLLDSHKGENRYGPSPKYFSY